MALLLENTTCGRCGGSGKYSFNMMHGSTCFGCAGSGAKLTKRGRVAQAWLNNQRMVRADSLQIGDTYFSQGFNAGSYSEPNRWVKIDGIKATEAGGIELSGEDVKRVGQQFSKSGLTCGASALVRKAMTGPEKVALQQAALEFQAALNKSGKVAKLDISL